MYARFIPEYQIAIISKPYSSVYERRHSRTLDVVHDHHLIKKRLDYIRIRWNRIPHIETYYKFIWTYIDIFFYFRCVGVAYYTEASAQRHFCWIRSLVGCTQSGLSCSSEILAYVRDIFLGLGGM